MGVNKVLFSSLSIEWETPDYVFEALDNEFHFTLDAAATVENAKCERYFTREQDGLCQSWVNETVFCNPPYGNHVTGKWVEKAHREWMNNNATVVLLIPSRTGTDYWHKYIFGYATVRFLRGRLKFSSSEYNAPFDAAIVIFRTPGRARIK